MVYTGGEEGQAGVAADVLQAAVVRLSLGVHYRVHSHSRHRLALQLRSRHLQVCPRLRRRHAVGGHQGTDSELLVQHGSTYVLYTPSLSQHSTT